MHDARKWQANGKWQMVPQAAASWCGKRPSRWVPRRATPRACATIGRPAAATERRGSGTVGQAWPATWRRSPSTDRLRWCWAGARGVSRRNGCAAVRRCPSPQRVRRPRMRMGPCRSRQRWPRRSAAQRGLRLSRRRAARWAAAGPLQSSRWSWRGARAKLRRSRYRLGSGAGGGR